MEIMRFKTEKEIKEYMQKYFPSFYLSFKGKRTLIFSCKYFQPNENKMVSNKRRYKKKNTGFSVNDYVFEPNQLDFNEFFTKTKIEYTFCDANINVGYLKNEEIWYIKKITTHTCGLSYNLDSALVGLTISNTTGYVAPYPSTNTEMKRPVANNEYVFNLWLTSLMRGGGAIGPFVNSNENKYTYEMVYSIIMKQLSDEKPFYCGLISIYDKIILIVDGANYISYPGIGENLKIEAAMRIDENFLRSEIEGLNVHTFLDQTAFLNQFNCTTFIYKSDINRFLEHIYGREKNDTVLILPTIYQTYAHEFNLLNLHNSDIYATAYNSSIFFGFFNICRKPVYEVAIRRRRTHFQGDLSAQNTNTFGYNIELVGWNGNNERQLIAFSVLDGSISMEMFEQFINFSYIHLGEHQFDRSSCEFETPSSFSAIREDFLKSSTFIVPYNEDILSLCIGIELPFLINSRSICEEILDRIKLTRHTEYINFHKEIEKFYRIVSYAEDEGNYMNNYIIKNLEKIPEKYYLLNFNRNSKYMNKRVFGLNTSRLIYQYSGDIADLNISLFDAISENIDRANSSYEPTPHNISYKIEVDYADDIKQSIMHNILNEGNNYANTPYYIIAKILRQLRRPINTVYLIEEGRREEIIYGGPSIFEVNLREWSCTCNFFNIYLIPCIHALVSIHVKYDEYNIFDFISIIHTDNASTGKIKKVGEESI